MKKTLFVAGVFACFLVTACNDNQNAAGTHTHDDGSTHTDHAPDATQPVQQEFTVGDSTGADPAAQKEHTHADGEKHTH